MARNHKVVLVVDDDVELVTMVEMVLNGAGYQVITAFEGREALNLVDKEMPDVILLDMKMPGMDGWGFAREYRSRYTSCAPVVVFTAADDARRRAEEIGAEGYLGKPFDIDDLIDVIEKAMRDSA